MANKTLFASLRGKLVPATDSLNAAGGKAYTLSPEASLTQLASTGCLNGTFYADGRSQLDATLKFAAACDAAFVARVAVHARELGRMKDMPALLCAHLATRDLALFAKVFDRVIDDGRMLRTFVQIVRSGATGRKSFGSLPKRKVRALLDSWDDRKLLAASVGDAPSLGDIVKMVHPRPVSPSRAAFYARLIGRAHDTNALPDVVKALDAFRAGQTGDLPDAPFQLLASASLDRDGWVALARKVSWNTLRMNLNTFARHGVLDAPGMTSHIAARLRDADAVRRAKVFPYALMTAFMNCDDTVPTAVRDALQDAMDIALANVPAVSGRVVVCPDVSGSMQSAATGIRKGATSKVRCIDVAALVASAMLAKNRDALVLPFSDDVVSVKLNARDSVMTNARLLTALPSGGTNCSAPLARLNATKTKADLVVLVSDNMSWVDGNGGGRGTATMAEWAKFRATNPGAKLICLDIQPYATTQAAESDDIVNIGGFSDDVFTVVADVAEGRASSDHRVKRIRAIVL